MENASKAILIAGGVLIAILIISLGMYIWNIGTDAFGNVENNKQATLKQEEMVKFSQYVGILYGSEVENCIKRTISYNEVNGTNIKVKFNGKEYSKTSDICNKDATGNWKVNTILGQTSKNDKYKGQLEVDSKGNISKVIFELYASSDK